MSLSGLYRLASKSTRFGYIHRGCEEERQALASSECNSFIQSTEIDEDRLFVKPKAADSRREERYLWNRAVEGLKDLIWNARISGIVSRFTLIQGNYAGERCYNAHKGVATFLYCCLRLARAWGLMTWRMISARSFEGRVHEGDYLMIRLPVLGIRLVQIEKFAGLRNFSWIQAWKIH